MTERRKGGTDSNIDKAKAVLRELSNTEKQSVVKSVFVPIFTCSHASWIITERVLSQAQERLDQGWPNCGSRAACGCLSFPKNLYICFIFFISIAKCRNVVKWYCGS